MTGVTVDYVAPGEAIEAPVAEELTPPLPGPAEPKTLSLVAAGCAGTSGLALLLHWAGVVQMPAAVNFIVLPAGIALASFLAWTRRRYRRVLNRLKFGLFAGLAATAVYDLSRYLIVNLSPLTIDPFYAHPIFGSLMLGLPPEHIASQISGWAYHLWNGVGFAMMFVLALGPARWPWAVAWALTLQGFMLVSYPGLLGVRSTSPEFVIVSSLGHLFWGLTLGLMSERVRRRGLVT